MKKQTFHDALRDPTRAAILAQISRHSGTISAKNISSNIDIPLTTVYGHLKALEKDGLIVAIEERVRNLSKKVWKRTSILIEPEETRINNQHLKASVNKDPNVIASYVRYLNALLQENLIQLKKINSSKFEKFQRTSKAPVFVKLYGLTSEDYQYALSELMKLRRELWERSQRRGEKNYQRTQLHPTENNLLFFIGFSDLTTIIETK
ncbi:MAG: helix-turn-helix domain-containing protein [Candidatus Hermodarchaeota archaeon]